MIGTGGFVGQRNLTPNRIVRQARRQRIILETSAEGIIVTDAKGTIETTVLVAVAGYTLWISQGHLREELVHFLG